MDDIERLAQEEIDIALETIDFDDDYLDGYEEETLDHIHVTDALQPDIEMTEIKARPTTTDGTSDTGASPEPVREASLATNGSMVENSSMSRPAKPPKATSMSRAAFHIFKSNVGAGIFLLPTFYTNAGYIAGVCLAIFAGVILLDCTIMLIRVKARVNRPDAQTYPAVVGFVLGPQLKNFVKFALVLTQFGFCTMYIQYVASLLAEIFKFKFAYQFFVILSVAAVTPMTFLTSKLHILAVASLIASVCVVFVIAGSIFLSFDRLGVEGFSDAVPVVTPTKWVLFLAGHVMALEGIGVVLPVENSVKDKEKFPTLVRWTVGSIITGYVIFGQIGYYAFGSKLKSSVVHAFPESFLVALLQLALAVSLLLSYPIQYVPAIQIVDRMLKLRSPNSMKGKAVRVALNIFFAILASIVGAETLGVFAEFLGAFVGTHLTMTMPAMMTLLLDDAIEGKSAEMSRLQFLSLAYKPPMSWNKVKCLLYTAFSLIIWSVGTISCVYEAVELYKGGDEGGGENPTVPILTRVPGTFAPNESPSWNATVEWSSSFGGP